MYSSKTVKASVHKHRAVIVAAEFYRRPLKLGVVGESLPHVSHYYKEPWPYVDRDVVIVGAANSAVIAALECWRAGARVHLVHRGSRLSTSVKYWLAPDVMNRFAAGEIHVYWQHTVTAIDDRTVRLTDQNGEPQVLPAHHVLLLTGYRSNYHMLRRFGIRLGDGNRPLVDAATLRADGQSNMYLAGGVLCGDNTGARFIENGREDARLLPRRSSLHMTLPDLRGALLVSSLLPPPRTWLAMASPARRRPASP